MRRLPGFRLRRRGLLLLASTIGVALLTQAGVGACKPLENPCPEDPFDAAAYHYECGWDPCWIDCDLHGGLNGACINPGVHCVECEPLREWLETCTECDVEWSDETHVSVSCITNEWW